MAFDEMDETQLVQLSDLADDPAEGDTVIAPMPNDQDATIVAPMPPEVAVADEVTGSTRVDDLPTSEPQAQLGDARIATLTERFTAFCIDSYLLVVLYWASVQIYLWKTTGNPIGLAPTNGRSNGLLFHAAFLGMCLLYYFVFEGTLAATPGKLVCKLRIQSSNGAVPSLISVMLRNLFRILDYVPFVIPGGVALLCMEVSAYDQRLGDLVARTVCVRHRSEREARHIQWNHIASVLGRASAGLIDLLAFLAICFGFALLLRDDQALRSQWIALLIPLASIGLWSCIQTYGQTTPGMWLFGYALSQENGAPIGLAHAFMRTITLPLDAVGLGLFAIIFSPRRQRIGDMIAGTLVVSAPRTARSAGIIASITVFVAICSYLGAGHPNGLRTPEGNMNASFDWTFLPRTEIAPNWPPAGVPTEPFMIRNFRFAEGSPNNTRSPASYVPGERIWFVFDVHGFTTKRGEVWIQEDLAIRYPDNSFGLRQENIIDYNQVKRTSGPLELKNDILLPEGFPAGRYTVFITVRDRYADRPAVVYNRDFYVKEAQ